MYSTNSAVSHLCFQNTLGQRRKTGTREKENREEKASRGSGAGGAETPPQRREGLPGSPRAGGRLLSAPAPLG